MIRFPQLFVMLAFLYLMCLPYANASSEDNNKNFYKFMYANSTSISSYHTDPDWRKKFPYLEHLISKWNLKINNSKFSIVKVDYQYTNLPQFALHITNDNNKSLLVYNHGHGGIPSETETWARDFLTQAFNDGYDLLITSMPATGLNQVSSLDNYWIKTHGKKNYKSIIDKKLFEGWSHYLYEVIADPDSYLHYFVDHALILPNALSNNKKHYEFSKDLINFPSPKYDSLVYVGLSGGGTTGLSACALLAYDKCILIAGFLPLYIRVQFESSWGDAEQTSRSIYGHYPYELLMDLAEKKSKKIKYIYNKYDPCCFSGPASEIFKNDFPDAYIQITNLSYHGYKSLDLLNLIRE